MRRYVKNIIEYLTEALNKAEWLNYKSDSALNVPDPDDDISNMAALVQRLLNVDDPAKLLFTGDEVSIGEDYRYFVENVIPKSEQIDSGTYPDSNSFTAYYSLYKENDRFFVKIDIKGTYEYSYIFIKEEDYDYFDALDAPVVPKTIEEKPEEETPAQAAPAQPAGGGGGLSIV